MVIRACRLHTWEVEAEGAGAEGSLGYNDALSQKSQINTFNKVKKPWAYIYVGI